MSTERTLCSRNTADAPARFFSLTHPTPHHPSPGGEMELSYREAHPTFLGGAHRRRRGGRPHGLCGSRVARGEMLQSCASIPGFTDCPLGRAFNTATNQTTSQVGDPRGPPSSPLLSPVVKPPLTFRVIHTPTPPVDPRTGTGALDGRTGTDHKNEKGSMMEE